MLFNLGVLLLIIIIYKSSNNTNISIIPLVDLVKQVCVRNVICQNGMKGRKWVGNQLYTLFIRVKFYKDI